MSDLIGEISGNQDISGSISSDIQIIYRGYAAYIEGASVNNNGDLILSLINANQETTDVTVGHVKGGKGDTGYYFTPSIDSNGNISWTNNGGLENPATKNVKGDKGDTGEAAGFGTPTVSVSTLPSGSDAEVIITSSGSDTEKVFNFDIRIPRGMDGTGSGDMLKMDYDTGTYDPISSPSVDNARNLEGHGASDFATSNHTHSNYALSGHTHSNYENVIESVEIDGVARPVTDKAIDIPLTETIQSLGNGNLLQNADWGYSLVNQRLYSGTAASDGFCIDRWYVYNVGESVSAVTPVSGSHITLGAKTVIEQRMEIIPQLLSEKDCVVCVQRSDGATESRSTTFPIIPNNPSSASVLHYSNNFFDSNFSIAVGFRKVNTSLCGVSCVYAPIFRIEVNNSPVEIRRVWLELGNINHMDSTPPKSYNNNLLECSRFLYYVGRNTTRFIRSGRYTARYLYFDLTIPAPMRVTPSIFSGSGYAPTFAIYPHPNPTSDPYYYSAISDFTTTIEASEPYCTLRLRAEKEGHGLIDASLGINDYYFTAEL